MLRPDRCIVAKELYRGSGRRPRPQDQLALEVFALLARDARIVLDVGAYTGLFSLLAGRVAPHARVDAFEVVPEVVAAADDNVAANDLGGRITVHAEGIGEDGAVIRVGSGRSGSALPDFYSTQLDFPNGIEVKLRSLDSVLHEIPQGSSVIIKIDVEGTEDDVLQHGRESLRKYRPDILCEVLAGVANVPAVQEALAPHGYRFFRVEEREVVECAELLPHDDYRDWLFTTRTAAELAACGVPVRSRRANPTARRRDSAG